MYKIVKDCSGKQKELKKSHLASTIEYGTYSDGSKSIMKYDINGDLYYYKSTYPNGDLLDEFYNKIEIIGDMYKEIRISNDEITELEETKIGDRKLKIKKTFNLNGEILDQSRSFLDENGELIYFNDNGNVINTIYDYKNRITLREFSDKEDIDNKTSIAYVYSNDEDIIPSTIHFIGNIYVIKDYNEDTEEYNCTCINKSDGEICEDKLSKSMVECNNYLDSYYYIENSKGEILWGTPDIKIFYRKGIDLKDINNFEIKFDKKDRLKYVKYSDGTSVKITYRENKFNDDDIISKFQKIYNTRHIDKTNDSDYIINTKPKVIDIAKYFK